MSASEQVYALLIEANPVPDPDALTSTLRRPAPALHVLDPGRIPMQTRKKVKPVAPKEPPQKRWFAAAAAAVIVIAVVGAIAWLAADSDESSPVVDSPAPAVTAPEAVKVETQRQAEAIARAEQYFAALNAGDVDEMAALAQPDEGDRLMFEHNAAIAAEHPFKVTGCVAAETTDELVVVECGLGMSDPVFAALGAAEIVAPWWVYDDGSMVWREWQGIDPVELNTAYRDYLLANDPEAYAAVCDPSKHTFGTINFGGGMAFTPDCAQLQLQVAADVAAWIEEGRPES